MRVPSLLLCLLALSCAVAVATSDAAAVVATPRPQPPADPTNCTATDAHLWSLRTIVCMSIAGPTTWWCPYKGPSSKLVHHDWPSQTAYMVWLLDALSQPNVTAPQCLNTSTGTAIIAWLNGPMADTSIGGTYMQQFLVFQVGYYNMPRKPGRRIESPLTLGLKCFAMAYNAEAWAGGVAFERALRAAGMPPATNWTGAFARAVPLTLRLCDEVMANCFVNQSYDPQARNGTCPLSIDYFYAGYDYQNLIKGYPVKHWPFPSYGHHRRRRTTAHGGRVLEGEVLHGQRLEMAALLAMRRDAALTFGVEDP